MAEKKTRDGFVQYAIASLAPKNTQSAYIYIYIYIYVHRAELDSFTSNVVRISTCVSTIGSAEAPPLGMWAQVPCRMWSLYVKGCRNK